MLNFELRFKTEESGRDGEMTIIVNGKERELAGGATVLALLEALQMEIERVAVELNRTILPKNRFAETALTDGDSLEIVQFVGGG